MNKKQTIKLSEAKIMVYLSQVDNTIKNLSKISTKLDMEYGYCIRVLRHMVAKEWLFKHKINQNMFYDLRNDAPLDKAKQRLEQ